MNTHEPLKQQAGAIMKRIYDGEILHVESESFNGTISMHGAEVKFPDGLRTISYTRFFLEVALANNCSMTFQRVY